MSLKGRMLGPLGAIALLLGMMSGAVAQSGSGITQPVSVTVLNQPCAIDIVPGAGPDTFGTWEWVGNGYQNQSGGSSVVLNATFWSSPHGGCDLIFGFTGLSDASGQHHIPATSSYFRAWSGGAHTPQGDPSGWTDRDVPASPGGVFPFSYTLTAVPTDLPEGAYTGTVKVSVSNAA